MISGRERAILVHAWHCGTMRILACAVVLFLVAACGTDDGGESDTDAMTVSTPSADGVTVARDAPDWVEPTMDAQGGAGVDDEGNAVVVTLGSSTNPHVVSEFSAEGQIITVTVANDPDAPSTMDLVPTTSTFPLPDGVAVDEPITIVITDAGEVEVGPDLPAFLWIGATDPEE